MPSWPDMPLWLEKICSSGLFAAVFSIIPGVAHLFRGQFRTIFWYCIAWMVTLAMTIFFWCGFWGILCLGLTLAIHVWIAMRAGILQEFPYFRERIVGFLVLGLVYYLIYTNSSRYILRIYDIQTGYSLINANQAEIQVGDYLIGRRRDFTLQRGDFVFTRLRGAAAHGQAIESNGFVQIVGLPGEKLEIRDQFFFINGKKLDSGHYPVPGWLRGVKNYSVDLASDRYFVVAEFRRMGNIAGLINNACIFSRSDFQSRAFLRWWPLRNRGYIRSD